MLWCFGNLYKANPTLSSLSQQVYETICLTQYDVFSKSKVLNHGWWRGIFRLSFSWECDRPWADWRKCLVDQKRSWRTHIVDDRFASEDKSRALKSNQNQRELYICKSSPSSLFLSRKISFLLCRVHRSLIEAGNRLNNLRMFCILIDYCFPCSLIRATVAIAERVAQLIQVYSGFLEK